MGNQTQMGKHAWMGKHQNGVQSAGPAQRVGDSYGQGGLCTVSSGVSVVLLSGSGIPSEGHLCPASSLLEHKRSRELPPSPAHISGFLLHIILCNQSINEKYWMPTLRGGVLGIPQLLPTTHCRALLIGFPSNRRQQIGEEGMTGNPAIARKNYSSLVSMGITTPLLTHTSETQIVREQSN